MTCLLQVRREIDDVMADPEGPADLLRILDLPGAAALRPPPFRRGDAEAHGHPRHLVTAVPEKQGRHGGIDAAAHGHRQFAHPVFFP